METMRIVFYHTKDILKGRTMRIYGALFLVSMLVMLYMEMLQLSMDVEGNTYMLVSVLASIVNMVVTYIVVFLFLKAVRKERFTLQDIRYGLTKAPTFIVIGLLLSLIQIMLFSVSALLGGLYPLYVILYTIIYTIFVMWNAAIAYSVYDNASFGEVFTSGIRIMKDHIAEIFCAVLLFIVWKVSSQLIVPNIIGSLLGNTMYSGMIIPSLIKGSSISTGVMIGALFVNLLYYAIQYACLLPMYTYMAKLYNDEAAIYVPSATRLQTNKKK